MLTSWWRAIMEIDGRVGLSKFIWRRPKIPSNDSWLVEYFKGGKGIRHGILFPYLFVLPMEAFTKIMRFRVEESHNFNFHSNCADQRITHFEFNLQTTFLLFEATSDALKEFKGRSTNSWSPISNSFYFIIQSKKKT